MFKRLAAGLLALLLCLGLMIFVLIRRHIRNKKDIY